MSIYPFLRKVGLLWLTDVLTCLHLNFAYNQVSRFLWQNLKFSNDTQGKNYLAFVPQNSHTIPFLIYFSFLLSKNNKSVVFLGQIHNILDILNNDKFKDWILLTIYNKLTRHFYLPLKETKIDVILIDLQVEARDLISPKIKIITSFDMFKELIANEQNNFLK